MQFQKTPENAGKALASAESFVPRSSQAEPSTYPSLDTHEDHRQDFPQTAASPHQPAPEAIFEHGDAAPSRSEGSAEFLGRFSTSNWRTPQYTMQRIDTMGKSTTLSLTRRRLLALSDLSPSELRRIDPSFTLMTNAPTLVVLDHTLLLRVGELHLVVFQTYVLLFNPHAPATKRYVTALKDALRDSALPFELAAMECAIKQATEDLELQLVSITPRVGNLLTVLPTQMNATLLNELRLVKQALVELDARARALRIMLLDSLEDQEDLNGILQDQCIPPNVSDCLKHNEDEVESLYEYYLQRCEFCHSEAERFQENMRDLEENLLVSLSARRLELNKLALSLSIMTLALAVGTLVSAVFGMNLVSHLETHPHMFRIVTLGILVGVVILTAIIGLYVRIRLRKQMTGRMDYGSSGIHAS
eukprot:CAMPEP_0114251270 /NCGR_PEP_ID=MMETSP0058-20121206/15181_1 /TAXON_ID=36894 /ORGANISM="Pyramimonas parkeae, CCMP726" /LENGTH=417 /DNA_ID=CAMNT_0001365061 /DNA_START=555 /DNA_END=1809 /DNA_ORIENTATION=+